MIFYTFNSGQLARGKRQRIGACGGLPGVTVRTYTAELQCTTRRLYGILEENDHFHKAEGSANLLRDKTGKDNRHYRETQE
jgi:hypothetical protein